MLPTPSISVKSHYPHFSFSCLSSIYLLVDSSPFIVKYLLMLSPTLNNQIALVTGATGKLSRVVCLRLAQAGADLALHFHTNKSGAHDLKKMIEDLGRRCEIYSFDLAEPQAPQSLAEKVLADFGRVDILVHTASVFIGNRLAKTDDQFWQQMFDLHVTALFRLARTLENNFRRHSGAILNIADIWGLKPKAALLAYSVSKAALVALTKALAEELAPTTTVNAVAPGIIDFPPDFPDLLREKVIDRIPLHRPGRPEEIADLVVEIIANRYITGQVITIDGGRSLI
jgi:pteridine reductase